MITYISLKYRKYETNPSYIKYIYMYIIIIKFISNKNISLACSILINEKIKLFRYGKPFQLPY